MPVVKKQTQKKRINKSASVVDRIRPVGLHGGVKLLVYGRGKTGKTRFACTFPKPVLVIGTEDGTRSVSNVKGVDFVRMERSDDLDELVEMLKGGKYRSACLDTGGGLQDMILKEILGLEDVPLQKSWGIAKQQDWGTCSIQLKERLNRYLNLADTHEMKSVIIAHERNFNDDGASDMIFPTVGAALTPSAAGWLNGAVEYICQTFIREETKEVEVVKGKKTLQKPTGRMEYCLRIGPHPVYMTGFRVPMGVVIPDSVADPSYDKIRKYIEGKE